MKNKAPQLIPFQTRILSEFLWIYFCQNFSLVLTEEHKSSFLVTDTKVGSWKLAVTGAAENRSIKMLLGLHAVSIAIGGISQKPGFVEDRVEKRECLTLTVTLDHDVVDGAPVGRFVARVVELLEGSYGLTALVDEKSEKRRMREHNAPLKIGASHLFSKQHAYI